MHARVGACGCMWVRVGACACARLCVAVWERALLVTCNLICARSIGPARIALLRVRVRVGVCDEGSRTKAGDGQCNCARMPVVRVVRVVLIVRVVRVAEACQLARGPMPARALMCAAAFSLSVSREMSQPVSDFFENSQLREEGKSERSWPRRIRAEMAGRKKLRAHHSSKSTVKDGLGCSQKGSSPAVRVAGD
eukprot:1821436-Pleurochrysis_carterae.AAC.1